MAHGNKKYFFEDLKSQGDIIIAKPNPGQKRVNLYSLKNQIRLYLKGNEQSFETDLIENNNGTITVKRIS